MRDITFDRTNAVCGLFFVVVGIVFLVQALSVDLGTWNRIGPGGLPMILCLLLILLGGVIFVQALRVEGEPVGLIAWRGMLFILLAPIIFGVTVRPLGFVGAVFITALIAAFASFKMRPLPALVLAVALTVFSTVVFSYGLGLPFQRFGPWLNWF
ncbi:MAG TPA: tripartite tricarboxylate transporter TctB family protein [Rhizobiaceae bacterium]|nr:tripartite tricarboxylate transporter TctB family protein [Rhizobiaceae bacterium]